MSRVISKTGAPTVELGDWVNAQNSAEYTTIMNAHAAQMETGTIVPNPAFDAMVAAFLTATNQEIVD